jgi:membrane protease YdiL (CAAX protease family)
VTLVLLVLFVVDLAVTDPLRAVGHLGPFTIPASAPVALAIVVLLGAGRAPRELAGWRLAGPWWRGFLALALPAAGGAIAAAVVVTGSPGEVAGVVVHAATEEVIFRAAVPAIVAIAFGWVGVPPAVAGTVGVACSAWVFAVMPGHLQQMDAHADVLPFLAFGLAVGWAAWRTRSLLPGLVVHVLHNLGEPLGLGPAARTLLVGGLLLTLVLVADRAPTQILEERPLDPAVRRDPAARRA